MQSKVRSRAGRLLQGVVLLVGAAGVGVTALAAGTAPYTPFPSDPLYGYPLAWSTIQEWIDKGEWARIRDHGWRLFVGVNQPAVTGSPEPVFETWFTLPVTFAPKPNGLGASEGEFASVAPLGHRTTVNEVSTARYGNHAVGFQPQYNGGCGFAGKRFLNNGDIMIAGVYFSREFYDHVQTNRYYSSNVLDDLWQGQPTAVKNFPDKSFQVKHMYWPVPRDGMAALPVFPDYNPAPDPAAPSVPVKPTVLTKYNGYETWNLAVAVTAAKPESRTANVSYAWRDFYDIPVVPITDFYHEEITQAAYDALDSTDLCILNQSANAAYGRNFQPGDYLAAIAMHVMAREDAKGVPSGLLPSPADPKAQKNTWSMQTFWYAGVPARPDFKSRYSADKPGDLPDGAWQNYAMCQSYDAVEPKEGDGTPHVCSNPYIELVFPETYRSVASCITCHSAGGYPSAASLTDTTPGRAHYNSEQRGAVPLDYYRALLYTDFSWSIPLSAQPDVNPD